MSRITVDISGLLEKSAAERRKLKDQADQLVAKVTGEERDFTKEEREQLAELQTKIVERSKSDDLLKAQADLHAKSTEGGTPRTRADSKPGEKTSDAEDDGKSREKRYRDSFDRYVRHGMASLNEEQRDAMLGHKRLSVSDGQETRDLSSITGAAGGYMVPTEYVSSIEQAMKAFSGVLEAGPTILSTTTGADLQYPTVNDTTNKGEQVEESQISGSADPAFALVTFKAYLYSSKWVLVPIQLLQDAAFSVESLLTNLLGERLGRIQNERLTTGDGANKPFGIVNSSSLGKQVASGTAITFEELIDLQHSVDPAYRKGAKFMFNDATFAAVRKLKDSDGRPIWFPAAISGISGAPPSTLLGDPYVINTDMASMASGAKSVLYGQMSKYHVRRVREITLIRAVERWIDKGQVGFMAFARWDGRLIDAGTKPIKHILHP